MIRCENDVNKMPATAKKKKILGYILNFVHSFKPIIRYTIYKVQGAEEKCSKFFEVFVDEQLFN